MITLIGSEGSMGKRYQAILRSMKIPVNCFDEFDTIEAVIASTAQSDGVIIASPTKTHIDYLQHLLPVSRKVLCEKPVTRDFEKLTAIYALAKACRVKLTCMMQYQILSGHARLGDSSYNYFRTGPDGLVWDCFQIIGLADGKVTIDNTSPIWKCTINGKELNLGDMDKAYVDFVERWHFGRLDQNPHDVIRMHAKVIEFEKEFLSKQSAS